MSKNPPNDDLTSSLLRILEVEKRLLEEAYDGTNDSLQRMLKVEIEGVNEVIGDIKKPNGKTYVEILAESRVAFRNAFFPTFTDPSEEPGVN